MSANGTGKERLVRKAAIWHDFSADGRRIVFTSNRDQQREIYVMKADGSGQKRLTRRAGDDWAPRFSPDGQRIAFTQLRGDDLDHERHRHRPAEADRRHGRRLATLTVTWSRGRRSRRPRPAG